MLDPSSKFLPSHNPQCFPTSHTLRHNKTDILDVIREYQKPERQQELMQISKNAQEFSIK